MTLPLIDAVATFCQQQQILEPNDHIVVGVSGGPDSFCLLHLLTRLAAQFDLTLTVAHLNHQLRAEAAGDAKFVKEITTEWDLPFVAESQDVAQVAAQRKQSIEEAARQVRYAFLWRAAQAVRANKIAVGHNAGDQVETILMHFLRGSGLLGLRGMRPVTSIAGLRLHSDDVPEPTDAAPFLIRPLLETSRSEIEGYCQRHHLSPRFDHTNKDTTFFRNRLRHELIPMLETFNPNVRQVLQRTAKVVTADVAFLQQQVDQTWAEIVKQIQPGTGPITRIELDLTAWRALPLALKRATLRRAVETLRRNLRNISFEHIDTAVDIAHSGQTGARATLPQDLLLTVSYDRLILTDAHTGTVGKDAPRLLSADPLAINLPGITPLPDSPWQLIIEQLPTNAAITPKQAQQAGPWEAYLDAGVVGTHPILRTRRPGDVFCPLGLEGRHKKINEFMIDQKIPADQRDHIPLLVSGDQILWVCGYRPDERARLQDQTRQILHLQFQKRGRNWQD